jgi:hypothetical protein
VEMRGYKGNPDLKNKRTGKISNKEYFEMIHEENNEPVVENFVQQHRIIATSGSTLMDFPLTYPY